MKDIFSHTKKCSSCRAGEIDQPADYFCFGKIWDSNDRTRPFRGYLCEDHYTMLLEDGAEFSAADPIGEKLREQLDELTVQHTAYPSFERLCMNNPTIRTPLAGFAGAMKLRKYFKLATGREAAK